MRVIFDSQIFCAQRFGGISRYFASLAQEMAGIEGVSPRIVAPLHINEYVAHLPPQLVLGRKIRDGRRAKLLARAVSLVRGVGLEHSLKPDVVHETYFYPRTRWGRSAPTILSVYDMTYERFPEKFPGGETIARWKARAVAAADHVICISERTKRDLLEFCSIPAERVSVTYLGYDALADLVTSRAPAEFREQVLGADKPYVLYVGSRTGCKNFDGLLRAFSASAAIRSTYTLVCFGGGGFTIPENELIAKEGLQDRVRQVSGPDSALADCYRHAAAFIYPSLYEGFGIPPLEAMSLDCPVVCSNASSIPEVVGDAAVTFDPTDSDAMSGALERVLGSHALRSDLIERGRRRREMFSWQRCARETLAIYQRTLQQ